MIDPRKTKFGPYLRCLADMMGLRDWTVTVTNEAFDDVNAKADQPSGRKIHWVSLGEPFLDSPPEEQRQTLVHELIHAHLAPMHHFLCRELGDGAAMEAYRLWMEYAVDGMADEWAKLLPLPAQVRPRKPKPASKPKSRRKAAR